MNLSSNCFSLIVTALSVCMTGGCTEIGTTCYHDSAQVQMPDDIRQAIEIDRIDFQVSDLIHRAAAGKLIGVPEDQIRSALARSDDLAIDLPRNREIVTFHLPPIDEANAARDLRPIFWIAICRQCRCVSECHYHNEPVL